MFELFSIEGLTTSELRELAYDCGFIKRSNQKIDALCFLNITCLESQNGSPSFNDLAAGLDSTYDISVSKQAIGKRFNESCILFFQAVLSRLIKTKISRSNIDISEFGFRYKRVLVQDSTIIKLPSRLYEVFSGVSNASSAVCNARIQGTYDLLSGCFISFSIDPYSKNDLTAAPELIIQERDLVLRDRGYYTYSEIERHVIENADCIYRHKQCATYLDPNSNEVIDLENILIKNVKLDRVVCLNNKQRTIVRLIAIPVSEEVANRRRQKAKKEMKGHNPSKEVLNLMSWTIFITTIPAEQADFDKIFNLYRLRWRIETIFKAWKSHMNFDKVHNVSERQLRILLTARFIMVVIITQIIYEPYRQIVRKQYSKELSMIKLTNYLTKNTKRISELLIAIFEKNEYQHTGTLAKYCTYDKRKRMNFNQMKSSFLG